MGNGRRRKRRRKGEQKNGIINIKIEKWTKVWRVSDDVN